MNGAEDLRSILLVGSGAIACRHARLLRELSPNVQISRLNSGRPAAQPEIDDYVDGLLADWSEVITLRPQAAIVANAAVGHADVVANLLSAQIPTLVEKPLAASTSDLDVIEKAAASSSVAVLVGYCLRYHPLAQRARSLLDDGAVGTVLGVRAFAGQHLSGWRPGREIADTVSTRTDLGGGVILELSHEVDLTLWFAGAVSGVSAAMSRSGLFPGDAEDLASLTLSHRSGAVSSVSLNMVEHRPRRAITVLGTAATLHIDFAAGTMTCDAAHGEPTVEKVPSTWTPDDMYRAQLRHFSDCVYRGSTPLVPLSSAAETARVCLAAHRAARFNTTELP